MASASIKINGLRALKTTIRRSGKQVQEANLRIEKLAEQTLERVKRRTPRSDRNVNVHTQDAWFLTKIGGGPKDRGFFLSIDHPFNQPGATQTESYPGGSTTRLVNDGNFNLLEALEFGTSPHVIRAKNQTNLTFLVDGQFVSKPEVFHPGTKAHGMIRQAVVVAERRIIDILALLRRKLEAL